MPKKSKRTYPERDLVHLPLMKWAKMHPICRENLIHIANERITSPRQGAMLKAMGVAAGIADLFLMVPIGGFASGYGGYWIELKASSKKPSAIQAAFLSKARGLGYAADYFDDWVKAKESIENYLAGKYVIKS